MTLSDHLSHIVSALPSEPDEAGRTRTAIAVQALESLLTLARYREGLLDALATKDETSTSYYQRKIAEREAIIALRVEQLAACNRAAKEC
jgi:hypothetical protein